MATDKSEGAKSKQGFIAIDIDGTALVEKIDKNFGYGLINDQSHVRQTLIQYIRAAQEAGYDIIILTARPAPIEFALKNLNIGTKPTQDIVDYLKEHDIRVKEIARSPAGLKGKKMQELIKGYPEGAIGVLFDDQLKQVNDVKKQGNEQLKAFDVNSKEDLEEYLGLIQLADAHPLIGEGHPFHPENIIKSVLGDSLGNRNQDLINLNQKLNTLETKFPNEARDMKKILNELCIRFFEADYRQYKPEIDWINAAAKHLNVLTDKLSDNSQITYADLERARYGIFAKSRLAHVIPNSRCDELIKNFLQQMIKFPLIDELRTQCDRFSAALAYEGHNNTEGEEKKTIERQQIAVNELIETLNNKDPNTALKNFQGQFESNKDVFENTTAGKGFVGSIRTILKSLPLIGSLFEKESEKITHEIKNISQFYKNKLRDLKADDAPTIEEQVDIQPGRSTS